MKPAISVIMTVYNAGAYLREAIESVLGQTWRDFEYIIVNDGSTDGSDAVIRGFADSRIVCIDNGANIGQTRSLNKAIAVARGSFLARMDADDISFPTRFAEQVEYLRKNDHVAVVGTWHQEVDGQGRVIRKCRFPRSPSVKTRLAFARLVGWASISHPTVMIRKTVLDNVGCYNPEFSICQDYDLWVRIARKYAIENIGKVLLGYRIHASSLTKKYSERTMNEYHEIIRRDIDYHMTGRCNEEKACLFAMLSNVPLGKDADINALFSLFDEYLVRILNDRSDSGRADLSYHHDLSCMLKAHYIPQLMRSHRRDVMLLLFQTLLHSPQTLLSRRFIANIKHSLS